VVFAGDGGDGGDGEVVRKEIELPSRGPGAAAAADAAAAGAITVVDGYIPSAKKRSAALLQLAQQNRVDEVRELLEQRRGPVDADTQDRFGNSGLLIAAKNGYKRLTKLFVRFGADLGRQNRDGNTALHYARGMGHTAIFDFLLAKGADDTVVNEQGLTCYQYNP
jgi:ankyrin repeat protein